MDQEFKVRMRDGRELELGEFIQEIKQLHKKKIEAGGGMPSERLGFVDQCISELVAGAGGRAGVKFKGRFDVECVGADGRIKWTEKINNLVVDEGMNHILDALFSSEVSVSPWYVGLTDGAPVTVAAGDTMASHAGWAEDANYSGNRKVFVDVRASQTVDNSASKASFSINATTTIGGAFLTSDATGTAGKLLCAGAFTGGDRSVVNGDTLNVTYTFTAADDGV